MEEDIRFLEQKLDSIYVWCGCSIRNAIERILNELERLRKENEKIKEKHKITCELNVGLLENIQDFIPKQAIRDKIELFTKQAEEVGENKCQWTNVGVIDLLKELLG